MKNDKIKFLLCALFFIVIAAITFRCAWGADMVFSASDVNIGGLAHRKNAGMDLFFGFFGSSPVLGSTNYSYSLFNIFVALIPLHLFSDLFYGTVLATGSLSLVWFLRLWKRSWAASIFGALIAFWFNSIMLAAGGHVYKMEVLAFSVLSLCFIEKAIRAVSFRKSTGFSLLAGLAVGVMMIEQQDVALLAGLFVGPYALFRLVQAHRFALLRWVCVLFPIALVSLMLSGYTLSKSYRDNITNAAQVQGNGDGKWDYVTQWSMVPSEWPDLVALGWSGWSSNNPEGPYWGKLGQSAEWEVTKQGFRNFKLTSNYFGIIPFLLGGLGLAMALRGRKSEEGAQILFWSVAGLLGLWLAFGKYSILYKLFYQFPVVGNIRAPIKFLDNFQICLGIVAAYGLDCLLIGGAGKKSSKVLWVVSSVLAGLMLLTGLKLLAFPSAQKAEFTQIGFGPYVDTILANMSNAWFHGALLAFIAAALIFMVWKGWKSTTWIAVIFIVVLSVDSLVLTSHYFRAENISALKKGNVVTNFLKENQGNERAFFMDQGGIYNRWLAVDRAYHGLNIFNIWQMNRMPSEYKEFLGTVGRNQIRLWELSAIKYIAAPSEILQQFSKNPQLGRMFTPVLNYQVPTAQGMRKDVLLEFKAAIPRFALFSGWDVQPLEKQCAILAGAKHNPQTTLLLEPIAGIALQKSANKNMPVKSAVLTKKDATVSLSVSEPAILRFAQRHQPGWQVFVDGKEAVLLRVDYLCMGVQLPPGEHVVQFKCPRTHEALYVAIVFVVSLVGGALLTRNGKQTVC